MVTEASIEIDRSVDEVFAFATVYLSEWSLHISDIKFLNKTDDFIGSTFEASVEQHGEKVTFKGLVCAFEVPHLYSLKLVGDRFDINVDFHFKSSMQGTTVIRQVSRINPRGMLGILLRIMSPAVRKSACEELSKGLKNLKSIIESQSN